MNEIYVTLVGNVAADPRAFRFEDGTHATSVRVASSRRYQDRRTQEWRNEPTTYYTVRCYRTLADHVARSVRRGHPVIVHGRLRMREVGAEEDRRLVPEIDAVAFGHDLRWGVAEFRKDTRPGLVRIPAAPAGEARFRYGSPERADAEQEGARQGEAGQIEVGQIETGEIETDRLETGRNDFAEGGAAEGDSEEGRPLAA